MGLMAEGVFAGAFTTRRLAKDWELSVETVGEYIREAGHVIRLLGEGNAEDLKAVVIASIETIRLAALQDHDWRAALTAIDLRSRLLGLFPETRLKVEVNAPDYSAATDDELRTVFAVQAAIRERSGR